MYWPIAFCTRSLATTMSTRSPFVPDSSTSCVGAREVGSRPGRLAAERPGAVGRVAGEGRAAAPGRSAWRAAAPPKSFTISLRSIARLTACRALIWLNGLMLTLSAKYQSAGSGLTCICDEKRPSSSGRRSAGRSSATQSACPRSTCVTAASPLRPKRCTIAIDVAVGLGRRRPGLEVRVAPRARAAGPASTRPRRRGRCRPAARRPCRSPRSPRSAAAARPAAARASAATRCRAA